MAKIDKNKCRYLLENGSQCQNQPKEGKDLCKGHFGLNQMDAAVYHAVTDHFKQDIREFFSRSNFYVVAEAAFLSAFFAIVSKTYGGGNATPDLQLWAIKGIAIAGLLLSVIWLLVAVSSAYWIKRWREQVRYVSNSYSNIKVYEDVEGVNWVKDKFRPEHITLLLPVLFLVFWIVATAKVF